MERIYWQPERSVEFTLPPSKMISLLVETGLQVERLIDVFPDHDVSQSSFDYMTPDWATKWPSEEIWIAKKK
jgi:hypothetical protein